MVIKALHRKLKGVSTKRYSAKAKRQKNKIGNNKNISTVPMSGRPGTISVENCITVSILVSNGRDYHYADLFSRIEQIKVPTVCLVILGRCTWLYWERCNYIYGFDYSRRTPSVTVHSVLTAGHVTTLLTDVMKVGWQVAVNGGTVHSLDRGHRPYVMWQPHVECKLKLIEQHTQIHLIVWKDQVAIS